MKTLIVYSTLTGNTQKVAEAIQEVFEVQADLAPVEDNPSAEGYDLILVGFWVDKGMADKKSKEYLSSLRHKKVGLFATLGAYPDSDHARQTMIQSSQLLDSSNQLTGTFICQGKVDPRLTAMYKQFPEGHPHAMTPERIARLQEAAKHPNEADFTKAKAVFAEVRRQLLAGEI
ncbi:flavodoxin family protein [Acetonema longum]|uniref:Flavodoxin family protein n=1 Tax=Acetonema longum DSM 6540 TaxID=1009370 RepID=F7NHH8_9FIRM|nr:flavodoxin family protein [Acetonema longum]EGO64525.1 flavodoxin family protein [Acetonema longum DSM 6540]